MSDEETAVVEDAKPDYDKMTTDQLLEEIGKAYAAKDMKLMGQLTKLHVKTEAAEEKSKRDKLEAELQTVVADTLKEFHGMAEKLVDAKKLEGAQGIWFAYDFAEKREKGINPSLRLTKGRARTSTPGTSAGTSSYVSNPAKSSDLLAVHGEAVMFEEDTLVKIDKVEHTMVAGTTLNEAYKYSTNGGWRNRVRMALLKEAGLTGS